MKILGISAGDQKAMDRYSNTMFYVIATAYRSLLRLIANHCIIPSLRIILFRLSGVHIGKRVQINMNVNFLDDYQPGTICLEDEVSVAPLVSFVASSHPNNSTLLNESDLVRSGKIIVKNGAWLGVGAVVMPGVTIGKAAVIGSNAVVTKNVEDYAVMVGIPARKAGDIRETHSNRSSDKQREAFKRRKSPAGDT